MEVEEKAVEENENGMAYSIALQFSLQQMFTSIQAKRDPHIPLQHFNENFDSFQCMFKRSTNTEM